MLGHWAALLPTPLPASPYLLKSAIDTASLGVWALQFTPRVAVLEDAVVAEMAGSARLFGDMAHLHALVEAGAVELGAKLAPRDHQLGDFKSSTGRLHSKLAIVDRRRMFIGSMNLDGRSARLNTEIGVLIDSPALAAQFTRFMPLRAANSNASLSSG